MCNLVDLLDISPKVTRAVRTSCAEVKSVRYLALYVVMLDDINRIFWFWKKAKERETMGVFITKENVFHGKF